MLGRAATNGTAAAATNGTAGATATNGTTGAAAADQAGSQNVGKGDGSQFITGQCVADADCASGCCAKPKGVCSARLVADEQGKEGCGFTGGGAGAGAAA